MRCSNLALLLLLTSCTVGPNFERPHVETAPAFGSEAQDVASRTYGGAVDSRWWASFGDPELTSLVDRLATQNLDLQQAAERVRQARAQRTIASSEGLPHVEADPKYTRKRQSFHGETSLEVPEPGAPLEYNLYEPQLQASWEIDLFGKVRRAVEAANARTEAAVEARNGIALAAIAELALDYMQLRQLQAEEAVLHDNLAAADRRVALTRNRFANGVATTLDIAQAEAETESIAQSLPDLRNRAAAMANAIALLLAKPPRALANELDIAASQPLVPPSVPVGLPGDLMRRRPDIRQAEAELHAATAETGVAVARFFPSINLLGNFGFESLSAASLFDWSSRAFAVGPTVTLPFFEGGRLKGNLALRKSEQREAAIAYHQAVLAGWRDADNALTAYEEAQHGAQAAQATLEADRHALAAAEDRHDQGIATMLDVVTEQQAVYRATDDVTRAKGQVEVALVTLYKALGGGWEAIGGQASSPTSDVASSRTRA